MWYVVINSIAIKIEHTGPLSLSNVTLYSELLYINIFWPNNVFNSNSVINIIAIKIPNVSKSKRVQGFFCRMYCVPDDMAALLPVLWFHLIKGTLWALVWSLNSANPLLKQHRGFFPNVVAWSTPNHSIRLAQIHPVMFHVLILLDLTRCKLTLKKYGYFIQIHFNGLIWFS